MRTFALNPKDSIVMELNFPNLPDENIPIGQVVVLWGEIGVYVASGLLE